LQAHPNAWLAGHAAGSSGGPDKRKEPTMSTFTPGRNSALKVIGAAACAAALWSAGPADASTTKCFGHEATITSNATRITGTSHDDVIVAGHGSQRITGGAGRDMICADGGNDRVDGGAGRDRIDGDEGDDRLVGGSEADEITGNRGDDVILGGSNTGDTHDLLAGGSGDDLIRGGDGRDLLRDGPGADVLSGEGGDDVLSPQDDRTADRYSGGIGVDVIDYGLDDDSPFKEGITVSLDGVENIGGSYGDDTLIGNDGANVIEDPDGYGTNTIMALGGADIVRGGDGTDAIQGGAGDDSLHGGYGDDSLDGGTDTDECFGDDGTDAAAGCETQIGFP
jgi:Ca2+-binding RTX toxin-like protein